MKLVIELHVEGAYSTHITNIGNVEDYWFDDGFLTAIHARGQVWIPQSRVVRLDEITLDV